MRIATYALALSCWMLVACRHMPEPPEGDNPKFGGYPSEVYHALKRHQCLDCHGESVRYAGLDVSLWESLKISGSLTPFSPEYSYFFWHVNRFDDLGIRGEPLMPVKLANNVWVGDSAAAMDYETVKMLRDWIAAGAPNGDGEIMWSEKSRSTENKYLFLASGADLMGQVDTRTGVVTRYVSVGDQPTRVESPHFVVSDGDYVYLTLIEGGKVEKYRADDLSFVARTKVGMLPAHVKVGKKYLIVTHWNPASTGEKLTIIDKTTMTITDQITGSFIHRPHGLAITQDFSRAYVTADDGNYFVTVTIDSTTGKFTGDYTETVLNGAAPSSSADIGPYQCVLSSDEKRLYVACSRENALYIYDVSKDEPKLKKKITSPGAAQCNAGLGLFPKLLTLADGKIFVVCYKEKCAASENRGREGCVSVFDEEGHWIKNIYGLGHQPHGIDYDAANGLIWVTCENQGGESHHAGPNGTLSPGQVNAVRVSDLSVVYSVPREVPPFPTGGVVIR